jgi:hypothetical protein
VSTEHLALSHVYVFFLQMAPKFFGQALGPLLEFQAQGWMSIVGLPVFAVRITRKMTMIMSNYTDTYLQNE